MSFARQQVTCVEGRPCCACRLRPACTCKYRGEVQLSLMADRPEHHRLPVRNQISRLWAHGLSILLVCNGDIEASYSGGPNISGPRQSDGLMDEVIHSRIQLLIELLKASERKANL